MVDGSLLRRASPPTAATSNPKEEVKNIIIYDGSGSIVIQPDPTGTIPGGLVRIDASECLVPYIVGPNIQPNSAATKQYVDSIASGVKPIEHVFLATTSGISPFPPTGQSAIDNVSPYVGDRVLVKDNASIDGSEATHAKRNGVYEVGTVTSGNAPFTRTKDCDTSGSLIGAIVLVEQGSVNAGLSFQQTTDSITLETTSICVKAFF